MFNYGSYVVSSVVMCHYWTNYILPADTFDFVSKQVLTTMKFVYIIARAGVKIGINFTSCGENGNEFARGVAECNFAISVTTSGIYPKISLPLELSQINAIASFSKVKISNF